MNVKTLDHKLTCLLHDQSGKKKWLDKLATVCARDLPFVLFFLPITVALHRDFFEGMLFVLFFLIVTVVAQIAAYLAQVLIQRKRPFQSEHLHPIYQARIPSPSFPSGHATFVSVTLWFTFAWAYPQDLWLFWLVLVMGITILVARVYGGLHYVSDILAGLLFGSGVLFLMVRLFNLLFSQVGPQM